MRGVLVIFAFVAVVLAISLWARRREGTVDDYYESEKKDPPIHGRTVGGGPGGF
jgi:hypothetical protein